jgi:hypothetical protein
MCRPRIDHAATTIWQQEISPPATIKAEDRSLKTALAPSVIRNSGGVLICFLTAVSVSLCYFGATWSRIVDFPTGVAPSVLPMVPVPLTIILSKSAKPTPRPSVSPRIATSRVPACLSPSGASARTPITTPCAPPPERGWKKLSSIPALCRHPRIASPVLLVSGVSPTITTSTVCPFSSTNACVRRSRWSGVMTRSASLASNWSLANRSDSAILFASAAARCASATCASACAAEAFALAMSALNPSAFAFASAECCSARAKLPCAFAARSVASAAPFSALPARSDALKASVLAFATSNCALWSTSSRSRAFFLPSSSEKGREDSSIFDAFLWQKREKPPSNVATTIVAKPSPKYPSFHLSWRLRKFWRDVSSVWMSSFSDLTSGDKVGFSALFIGWLFGTWLAVSAIIRQVRERKRRM